MNDCFIFSLLPVPPAPENVRLKRISPTAVEVSWTPPSFPGIAGYRIYYNMFAIPDMEQWQSMEIGPYTVTDISGLEPHTVYAVRVRAKSTDGRYGNFSEIVTTNNLAQGMALLSCGAILTSFTMYSMQKQFLLIEVPLHFHNRPPFLLTIYVACTY